MNPSTLRVLLFALPLLAADAFAAAQRPRETAVSLDVKERDLQDVLEFLRQQSGANIVLEEGVEEQVTLALADVPWRSALDLVAERAGCVVVVLAPNLFKVEKPPRVHFAFEDAEVTKVIDAIAKIAGANIVVSPEVKGTVTLRLRDVPWRDALETVAKSLNLVVVEEKRGILRVVLPSSLQAQTETRSFQLRYLRPPSTYTPKIDSPYVVSPFSGRQQFGQLGLGAGGMQTAAERVKKEFSLLQALEKALSPGIGKLDYIDRQNVLIVRDVSTVLDEIASIIEAMDVEPKQVFVDVKFVSLAKSDLDDFGVNYGDQGPRISIGGGQIPLDFPFHVDDLDANSTSFLDGIVPVPSPEPTITFGTLSFTQLQATLRLLRQDKTSDVQQAPQIIAIDHQPATIFVGDEVRYAQVRAEQGQAGGAFLSIEEAPGSPVKTGFQLLIIPHIVPGTEKVVMDIIPKQDSLSGTSPQSEISPAGFDVFTLVQGGTAGTASIALPRISSSTIATTLMLESGQTAVLGGLKTDTDIETESKIPLLGDLPILGWLFRHKIASTERRDFLVFVTPSLIRSPEEVDDWMKKELDRRGERMRREYEKLLGKPSEANASIEPPAAPHAGAGG